MTRSDVMLNMTIVKELIEKYMPKSDEKERCAFVSYYKEEIIDMITEMKDILDNQWSLMLEVNGCISDMHESDTYTRKLLTVVRNNMAKAFNEKDRYNT